MSPRDKCSAATGDLTRNQKSKHFKWKKSKNYSQLDTATINRPSLIQTQTISIFILNQYLFGLSLRLLSNHLKTFKLGRFTSKIDQHNFQIYSASLQSGRGGRVEVKKYLLLGRWSDKSPPQRLRRARKGREVRTRVTIVSCFNYLRLHRHKGR